MQQPKTIDILYIALLKIQAEGMLLGEEVNGVQSLCLPLCDRRNIGASLLRKVPGEVAARVLNDNAPVLMVKQRPSRVCRRSTKALAS